MLARIMAFAVGSALLTCFVSFLAGFSPEAAPLAYFFTLGAGMLVAGGQLCFRRQWAEAVFFAAVGAFVLIAAAVICRRGEAYRLMHPLREVGSFLPWTAGIAVILAAVFLLAPVIYRTAAEWWKWKDTYSEVRKFKVAKGVDRRWRRTG